jgi:5'-nucleotidase
VWLADSTVVGPVSVRQTSSATAPVIAGNRVIGLLACSGNSPAPTDNGDPNVVIGVATGQCAKL